MDTNKTENKLDPRVEEQIQFRIALMSEFANQFRLSGPQLLTTAAFLLMNECELRRASIDPKIRQYTKLELKALKEVVDKTIDKEIEKASESILKI